jgi:hypothetical protein
VHARAKQIRSQKITYKEEQTTQRKELKATTCTRDDAIKAHREKAQARTIARQEAVVNFVLHGGALLLLGFVAHFEGLLQVQEV